MCAAGLPCHLSSALAKQNEELRHYWRNSKKLPELQWVIWYVKSLVLSQSHEEQCLEVHTFQGHTSVFSSSELHGVSEAMSTPKNVVQVNVNEINLSVRKIKLPNITHLYWFLQVSNDYSSLSALPSIFRFLVTSGPPNGAILSLKDRAIHYNFWLHTIKISIFSAKSIIKHYCVQWSLCIFLLKYHFQRK